MLNNGNIEICQIIVIEKMNEIKGKEMVRLGRVILITYTALS